MAKKITINSWKESLKTIDESSDKAMFLGNEISIKHSLTLTEMISFVNGSMKSCFDEETDEYMPEVKDYVIKSNTIEFYTNLTLPKDLEERYTLIYDSWNILGEIIYKNINYTQYEEMLNSINERIENKLDFDAFNMRAEIEKSKKDIELLIEQISQIFSGLSKDDVESFAQTIIGAIGAINEEKIIKAIVPNTENSNGEGYVA